MSKLSQLLNIITQITPIAKIQAMVKSISVLV